MPNITEINGQLERARNSANRIVQQINQTAQKVQNTTSFATQSFGGGQAQSQLASSLCDASRCLRLASEIISNLQPTIQDCERFNMK